MKKGLIDLRDRLQLERQELLDQLQNVDDNLGSINKVIDLLESEKVASNDKQLKLIKEPITASSTRFMNLTFFESIKILFEENPGKHWRPGELADAVLKEGFSTKSKKFKNTVRTLLGNMRKDGRINALRTKGGWLYSGIKKDTVSHVDKRESLNREDESNEGSEPSKHPEPSY